MKHFSVFLLLLLTIGLTAQDEVLDHRVSLGGKKWGLGIGNNPLKYSGIKFNFLNASKTFNGISFNVLSEPLMAGNSMNGAAISLFLIDNDRINGFAFSPVSLLSCDKINGIFLSGLFSDLSNLNGIGLTGLVQMTTERINGIALAGLSVTTTNLNGIILGGIAGISGSTSNGIILSGIFAKAETNNGLLISLVTKSKTTHGMQIGLVNTCTYMQGMQIGLLNTIRQNPRWCRTLPFINFHVRKYVPRVDSFLTEDNCILVNKYKIDNRTLHSSETFTYDKASGKRIRHGPTKMYDRRGRLVKDLYYSCDTLISRKTITYQFDLSYVIKENGDTIDAVYNHRIEDYTAYSINDSVSETWKVENGDTIEITRTIKGITTATYRYPYSHNVFSIYYETSNGKEISYTSIYNGPPIYGDDKEAGTLKLIKGDTLDNSSRLPGDGYMVGEDLWFDGAEPLIKKNVIYFITRKGEFKGIAYEVPEDSVFVKKTYYNFRKNKLSGKAIYTKTDKADTTYFRSGKVRSFGDLNATTILNRRGKIFHQEVYEDCYYKSYSKEVLRELSTKDYYATFYKNGRIKTERLERGNYRQRIDILYRKDGSIKEERWYGEGMIFTYNKKKIMSAREMSWKEKNK